MKAQLNNGLTLEYECFGSARDPAILLIMGFAAQLTHWPVNLCEALARDGFYVIRFDNRDVGLSSKLDNLKPPNLQWKGLQRAMGFTPKAPYNLNDMTSDAISLLDVLGIERAHIVGASMGGMIAQLAAILYPKRVLSLTSIMSSSGNRKLPNPDKKIVTALMTPADDPNDPESVAQRLAINLKLLMSPLYPTSDADLLAKARTDTQRAYHPPGRMRQLAASLTATDRRKALRKLKMPVAVIHGASDPLLPPVHGEDTARSIPGAQMHMIEGYAHDFPVQLMPRLAAIISENASRTKG
ncbi:MAG: alpha/beta hydrolase [Parvularculaceae bacterium]|nr:alpha/beta hydrolase [Parvularculaceae bacterium]